MLCVLPTADMDPLRSVKWHPRDSDLVTVTSDNNIYIINIADAAHIFGGQPINQSELHRVASVWSVSSVCDSYFLPTYTTLIRFSYSPSLPSTMTSLVWQSEPSPRTRLLQCGTCATRHPFGQTRSEARTCHRLSCSLRRVLSLVAGMALFSNFCP